ncbi:DUF2256 domain-containing protein [Thalassotalea sp. PS06]|uniref:DUF2256 domain-containing protein n=1 Tax=Thalassotalea sp. PS06 TaxID=2594005 RepID=UPI00391A8A85
MKPAKPQKAFKICVVCERPFTWRKKWQRDWANVKYCSKRCAGMRKRTSGTDVSLYEQGNNR